MGQVKKSNVKKYITVLNLTRRKIFPSNNRVNIFGLRDKTPLMYSYETKLNQTSNFSTIENKFTVISTKTLFVKLFYMLRKHNNK